MSLIPYERQKKILQLIKDQGLIYIENLQAQVPEISISTLRRDLVELEKTGEIERLSGGGVRAFLTENELPVMTKSIRHTKEKQFIAKLAAKEVSNGDIVYLDSGSSGTILFKELLKLSIHIVTSNMELNKYSGKTKAKVTFLGGTFNSELSSVSGPVTIENIQNFIFDKSFIGANGIDVTFGITTPSLEETAKKKAVLRHSKNTYLLADHSKFGVVSQVKIFDIDQVTVISDKFNPEIADKTKMIYQ